MLQFEMGWVEQGLRPRLADLEPIASLWVLPIQLAYQTSGPGPTEPTHTYRAYEGPLVHIIMHHNCLQLPRHLQAITLNAGNTNRGCIHT